MKLRVALLTLAVLFWSTGALGGWVIVDRDQDGQEFTTFIQENSFKYEDSEAVTIFNVSKDMLTFIRPDKKMYWAGSPKEFQKELRTASDEFTKEQMASVPPEQRDAFKTMMNQEHGEESAEPSAKKTFHVEVKGPMETDTIAGQQASKYEIWVNGVLKEATWVTELEGLKKDMDVKQFTMMTGEMIGGSFLGWEDAPEVVAMRTKGFPLRTVEYEDGEAVYTSEVVKLEKKNFPPEFFTVPAGMRKVTVKEIMFVEE